MTLLQEIIETSLLHVDEDREVIVPKNEFIHHVRRNTHADIKDIELQIAKMVAKGIFTSVISGAQAFIYYDLKDKDTSAAISRLRQGGTS